MWKRGMLMRKQLILEGQCSALEVVAVKVKAGVLTSWAQKRKTSRRKKKTTADDPTKILMPGESVRKA